MTLADSILIVEEDPVIAGVIADVLHASARTVSRAASVAEAVFSARVEPPELIVLSLGSRDVDGVEPCRQLRAGSCAPLLVISNRRDERHIVQVLNAGADDYLMRPFSPKELVARVHAHLRRSLVYQAVPPPVIRLGELCVDLARRIATHGGRDVGLTPVEWQLLRILATNAGRTLTHQQLVHSIWGNVFGDAQQNLRVHIAHLRRKIEPMPSVPSIIVTEPGVGYRCEFPVESAAVARVG